MSGAHWCFVSVQLLEKRRQDHESELMDLEARFSTMFSQRQQSYDKELSRLRDENSDAVQYAVMREGERVREEMLGQMESALRAQRQELGSPARKQVCGDNGFSVTSAM